MASQNEKLFDRLMVLSEPTRLAILRIVSGSEGICASDILGNFDMRQPTLSHHMHVLEDSGLIIARKQGRFVRYYLDRKGIAEIAGLLEALAESKPSAVEVTPKKQESEQTAPSKEKVSKKKKKGEKKKKDKKKKK